MKTVELTRQYSEHTDNIFYVTGNADDGEYIPLSEVEKIIRNQRIKKIDRLAYSDNYVQGYTDAINDILEQCLKEQS